MKAIILSIKNYPTIYFLNSERAKIYDNINNILLQGDY